MDYKIVELGQIKIVGIKDRIIMPNNTIPSLWEKFMTRENEISKKKKGVYYGIADNMSTEAYEFDETIGVEVEEFENIPKDMCTYIIPAQKYIVFTHKGLLFDNGGVSLVSRSYDYIYSKFLPTSEFKVNNDFNFELYDSRYIENSNDSEFDIYVPIK